MSARPPEQLTGSVDSGAPFQLFEQVLPLEVELSSCCGQAHARSWSSNPGRIEVVSTSRSFLEDDSQIRIDRGDWPRVQTEPSELRMMTIPTRAPAENRSGQESFAPKRDKARTVQMPWVESPEPQKAGGFIGVRG